MSTKELVLQNQILKKALERIVSWEMPATGKFHGTGPRIKEYSYSYLYGSKGEREVIRKIAQEALNEINNLS